MIKIDKPKFITFEGINGCGKSTQAKLLHDHLIRIGIDNILTREPGGTPECENIRNLFLNGEVLPVTGLLLLLAARCEHVNKVIKPALDSGKWVICDRYIDSMCCYQSELLDLGMENLYFFQQECSELIPDITLFLDVNPLECALRVSLRDCDKDNKTIEYFENLRDKFTASSFIRNNKIIKGEHESSGIHKTIEQIHDEVKNVCLGSLL